MTTAINRNDKRRGLTRQKLVAAAASLFVSKGYNETTVDEICAEADVAKVTFYYHFQSKDDIVQEIKTAASREVFAAPTALLQQNAPALAILQSLFATVALWTEANWRLWQVFLGQKFQHVATSGGCDDAEPDPLVKLLIEIIDHGKANNEFRSDVNSLEMASFIGLVMLNNQVLWMKSGRNRSLSKDFENSFELILHGIDKG